MATVRLIGHDYSYPVCDVLQLFYGKASYLQDENSCVGGDDAWVLVSIVDGDTVTTELVDGEIRLSLLSTSDKVKREVKRQLYFVLSEILGMKFPWGSLTGIRPTLVAREAGDAGFLADFYGAREDKAHLAIETAKREDAVFSVMPPDGCVAYIGIPFCKSRCSYCSFISSDASSKEKLLAAFKECLLLEMRRFFEAPFSLPIEALYIGGGTPTVFDDDVFEDFMREALAVFVPFELKEITVEAGRPDTITEGKLRILHDLGVDRICINPQSLHDRTLRRIGREHSAEDFLRAYALAREIGFRTVNADLIAGLPGESYEDFRDTLERILELSPENITVHTLSQKRAAAMQVSDSFPEPSSEEMAQIDKMVQFADEALKRCGYVPYYLYRQKNTLAGLENTGYSKPGHECLYNVAMMSDKASVVAFGSGMSKRAFPGGRLERCPGLKSPDDYIHRIDSITERKIHFFEYN